MCELVKKTGNFRRLRGRKRHSRIEPMFRLVLVLSLWHAPIPWFHSHDLEGPEVEHTAALSHHVHGFHQAALEQGGLHTSWHMHLLLPWQSESLPCSEGDDDSPIRDALPDDCIACRADVAPAQQVTSLPAWENRGEGAYDLADAYDLWKPPGAAGGLPPLSCPGHFLATSGCSTSLIDLLSARLC